MWAQNKIVVYWLLSKVRENALKWTSMGQEFQHRGGYKWAQNLNPFVSTLMYLPHRSN